MSSTLAWHRACHVSDVPADGGACVLIDGRQIAVFYFSRRNEWFASDNLCPHRQQMALSRGMTGCQDGEPKVACPFHKKSFSLKSGACLSGDDCSIQIYPTQVIDDFIHIGLPSSAA